MFAQVVFLYEMHKKYFNASAKLNILVFTVYLFTGCTIHTSEEINGKTFHENILLEEKNISDTDNNKNVLNKNNIQIEKEILNGIFDEEEIQESVKISGKRNVTEKSSYLPVKDGKFNVNMVSVPVGQAADILLRDTLGLNYILDQNTQGNITIKTASPLDSSALFDTFRSALRMSGFTIHLDNGTYIISGNKHQTPRFNHGGNSPAGSGDIYVVPLQYIAAAEMLEILEPITGSHLQIDYNPDRNILLVSGNSAGIDAALEAVEMFDVDMMKGKSASRVELASADPSAVAEELSIIFDTAPGGTLSGVLEFIPNNILGSILIISSNPQYIQDAKKLIKEYENAIRTEIYELRNRSASELAEILSTLLKNIAQSSPSTNSSGQSPSAQGQPVRSQGSGITIVADETANAIIAHATSRKQKEISDLIDQLDDVADQVLIEAVIAEVQLNDSINFGVRHFFESGNFATEFSGLVSGGTTSIFPGFNAVFSDADMLDSAIDTLSSVTNVNIISSPSILVLDNREALLNIGDQVPVITQTSSSITDPDAPIVNSVNYRDTGIILKVRPRVDSSGRVILEVHQEVSVAVTTSTSQIDAPTIQQRTFSTTIAMDDGESLMIAGLIRKNDSNTRAKIPLLGDIPILGIPFRNTDVSNTRNELIIIITPRVIRNSVQANEITEEYRNRLFRPESLMENSELSNNDIIKNIIF